jgi:predicted O-methyltransferase YrrM
MNLADQLKSKTYRFARVDGAFISNIVLQPGGAITGSHSSNESFWDVQDGMLNFRNHRHEITTVFDRVVGSNPYEFIGYFVPRGTSQWYILTEITAQELDLQAIFEQIFGRVYDTFTISKCVELAASFDSALYFTQKMSGATRFRNKFDLLSDAMRRRPADGLVLEFGVYTGSTINRIAEMTDQRVYGFDVFSGLPVDWRPGFLQGAFRLSKLPEVRPNVELVVGLFEETLAPFLERCAGPASFIHVDCDLYSSTKAIFQSLSPRIGEGTIIVFDEYFNYPGWRDHEFKAFQEYIVDSGANYKYISFVDTHQQVAVQIAG